MEVMLAEYCRWEASGKPVVEEEPELTYKGVPWKLYSFATFDEAKKQLDEKDARIKELEAKLAEARAEGVSWLVKKGREEIRNAALEEAAKLVESGPPWLICHIEDRKGAATAIRRIYIRG
jgi:hypothetical protein